MTAYYNEIDPHAANWLRQLIAAGHLPIGDIDERSITEVRPNDLAGYDECHFFAGIGGWPYALRLAGWRGPVWTGSCPCQPLSRIGYRKGHADERHLWPAFYRLIAECRPATVFGEQVAGKDGREWLSAVRSDLSSIGYACGAADMCAAAFGANHLRERLWWVAHANGTRQNEWPSSRKQPLRHLDSAEIWWENQPRPDPVADGVPRRMERVRGAGNAIVPQVAAEFVSAFMECEQE